MSIRLHSFAVGELYHCYNRGVEKRIVFDDADDFSYFLKGLELYNSENSSQKMRNSSNTNDTDSAKVKLVCIHAYCLNKNHFHLILEELAEGGISKFLQKLVTSYVMYFNKKNERTGSLFQGKFKSIHIDTDEYLQHLGVYVNLNNLVHGVKDEAIYRSSMNEYVLPQKGLCETSLLCTSDPSKYEAYAHDVLPTILSRKEAMKEFKYSEFID
jgi:putative transposase